MTGASTPTDLLLSDLRDLLKRVGFKKRGKVFHRPVGDVVHLVGLQSGSASTRLSTQLTVNLAVWCKRLAEPGSEPTVATSQWRCRLGDLMPSKEDAWFSLAGPRAGEGARGAIVAAVKAYGLPALDGLPDLAALKALWETGRSPGLTPEQAARHLAELNLPSSGISRKVKS
jgi:hypothetical protein